MSKNEPRRHRKAVEHEEAQDAVAEHFQDRRRMELHDLPVGRRNDIAFRGRHLSAGRRAWLVVIRLAIRGVARLHVDDHFFCIHHLFACAPIPRPKAGALSAGEPHPGGADTAILSDVGRGARFIRPGDRFQRASRQIRKPEQEL